MKVRYLLVPLVLALIALIIGCGGDDIDVAVGDGLTGTKNSFENDDRLRVATTVAPLTSIVLNVAGNCAYVHGLITPGIDSHTYEPRPSDAVILSRADLLIMNGGSLEGTTEELAEANLADSSKIYKLADRTLAGDDPETGFLYDFSFPRADGRPNPHLWMSPIYARTYAELIRDALTENDPEQADCYWENFASLADVLERLDRAIRADSITVPEGARQLLTYHDSWAYWAREYGWTVIGAIQPSDFTEPSAQDVAEIIRQIKDLDVPVIFGSEVFPSTVLETIAQESGTEFEERLSDDEPPGESDDQGHTYVGMLVEDMRILFTALGGSVDTVSTVPVENTFKR